MARETKIKREVTNRYILQPYTGPSSRITCRNCGAKHSFARYVDKTTGDLLDEKFGRCDRVEKCGYFQPPSGKDVQNSTLMVSLKDVKKEFIKNNDFISILDFKRVVESMTFKDKFSNFLYKHFDSEEVTKVLLKYKVGESSKWEGATVFWQIDEELEVRTGKIILYGEDGKRVKKPFPKMYWEHLSDKGLEVIPDYNLAQCFFGTHLISDEIDTYHVVEAEKTALICSLNSDKTWLATGGIELITEARLKPLYGKKVIFYPDKGPKAYEKWSKKLEPFKDKMTIIVNKALEKTDLEEGADLADLKLKNLNINI